jgi:hypothetical protein
METKIDFNSSTISRGLPLSPIRKATRSINFVHYLQSQDVPDKSVTLHRSHRLYIRHQHLIGFVIYIYIYIYSLNVQIIL